jgi:hypothetical protein
LLQKNYGFEFVKDERKHLRGKAASNRGETLALQKNRKVAEIKLAIASIKDKKRLLKEYNEIYLVKKLNAILQKKDPKLASKSAESLQDFIAKHEIKFI